MTEPTSHLITFLGTGNYQRTCYEWIDGQRVETALFPSALPRFLPDIRSATVFVTVESEKKHGPSLDAEWPTDWKPRHVEIPKGASTDELWTIFERVVDAVPSDSRVVFDITHAFRSIPLISVLAVAYLWSARNVQLRALVYGAHDAAKGDPPVTPVFDLTPMVNLLEWIAAVERFRHHLDGEPLQQLLDQIQRRAYARRDPECPKRLQNVGNAVKRLTDALLMGRVREVLGQSPTLANALAGSELRDEAQRWAKPFVLMLEPLQKLLAEIGPGSETDLSAHYRLARFYSDRRLYPLAISLLREWIVSRACRLAGMSEGELFDERRREEVEHVLGACYGAKKSKEPLPTEPDWIQKLVDEGLLALWLKVPDIRNDIDHVGMRQRPSPADRLIAKIRDLFSDSPQE
jgi:CRISPR-associated DxTHG motif protein